MQNTIKHYTAYITRKEYMEHFFAPKEFIVFCKSCNKYGKTWACPPFRYDPKEIMAQFQHVYLIASKVDLQTQSLKDTEEKEEFYERIIKAIRAPLDQALLKFERDYPSSRVFYAGNCHLCPACTRFENIPCRYPEKMRASLEAYGFDVSKTTSTLFGLELDWGDKERLPKFLILVSGIMTNHKIEKGKLDLFLANNYK